MQSSVILASWRLSDKRATNILISQMWKQGSKRWSDLPVLKVQRWLVMEKLEVGPGGPPQICAPSLSLRPRKNRRTSGMSGGAGWLPIPKGKSLMRLGSQQLRTHIPSLSPLPARDWQLLSFLQRAANRMLLVQSSLGSTWSECNLANPLMKTLPRFPTALGMNSKP